MLDREDIRVSRRISRALRHDPGAFGLVLDGLGYAPLGEVLRACGCTREQLARIMEGSDKPRFEVAGGRIRATHGHTVAVDAGPAAEPPAVLYHGTTAAALGAILAEGLKPMGRQYVHLHEDRAVAWETGSRRRGRSPVMLVVDAAAAHADGIAFHPAQGGVWLARSVPAGYIRHEWAAGGTASGDAAGGKGE